MEWLWKWVLPSHIPSLYGLAAIHSSVGAWAWAEAVDFHSFERSVWYQKTYPMSYEAV